MPLYRRLSTFVGRLSCAEVVFDPSPDGPRPSMVFWEQPHASTQIPTITTLKRPRGSSIPLSNLIVASHISAYVEQVPPIGTDDLSFVACLQAVASNWFEGIVSVVQQREGDDEELDRRGAIPCRQEASLLLR